MSEVLITWLLKIVAAIGKQAAVAATPVAIAVTESLGETLTASVTASVSTTLTPAEKTEVWNTAWSELETSAAVCVREGGLLASEVTSLLADAVAGDIASTLGIETAKPMAKPAATPQS